MNICDYAAKLTTDIGVEVVPVDLRECDEQRRSEVHALLGNCSEIHELRGGDLVPEGVLFVVCDEQGYARLFEANARVSALWRSNGWSAYAFL